MPRCHVQVDAGVRISNTWYGKNKAEPGLVAPSQQPNRLNVRLSAIRIRVIGGYELIVEEEAVVASFEESERTMEILVFNLVQFTFTFTYMVVKKAIEPPRRNFRVKRWSCLRTKRK